MQYLTCLGPDTLSAEQNSQEPPNTSNFGRRAARCHAIRPGAVSLTLLFGAFIPCFSCTITPTGVQHSSVWNITAGLQPFVWSL